MQKTKKPRLSQGVFEREDVQGSMELSETIHELKGISMEWSLFGLFFFWLFPWPYPHLFEVIPIYPSIHPDHIFVWSRDLALVVTTWENQDLPGLSKSARLPVDGKLQGYPMARG